MRRRTVAGQVGRAPHEVRAELLGGEEGVAIVRREEALALSRGDRGELRSQRAHGPLQERGRRAPLCHDEGRHSQTVGDVA